MPTMGEVIQCKAAVLWKEGQPMTVETISVDPPQEGEVRVKMVGAGLCATDAHFVWDQKTDLVPDFEGNPIVLGHEGSAVVESVGPGVTGVRVGDQVLLSSLPECGHCRLCANPQTNACLSGNFFTLLYHKNRTTRMKVNGSALLALTGTSTFSQYSVVRESQIVKVNPRADLVTSCIISCAVSTGYESATNMVKVHRGSTCAVWGLGAVGLSAVLGCRDSGAETIIGIDTNPDKESIARQMGCNQFLNPKTSVVEEVLQRIGGVDYAFDCVGSQAVLESGRKSLTPWGTLAVIGLGPKGNSISLPVKDLLTGQTVAGGYIGKAKPRQTFQRLVDRYCSGQLNIEPLVTHRIALDDINKGFDILKAGQAIRVVIDYAK